MPRLSLGVSTNSGSNRAVDSGDGLLTGGTYTNPGLIYLNEINNWPGSVEYVSTQHSIVSIPAGLNIDFEYKPKALTQSVRIYKYWPYFTATGPNGQQSVNDFTLNYSPQNNDFRTNVTIQYDLYDGEGNYYDTESVDLGIFRLYYDPSLGAYGKWLFAGKLAHNGSIEILDSWSGITAISNIGDYLPPMGGSQIGQINGTLLLSSVQSLARTQPNFLYSPSHAVRWSSSNQVFLARSVSCFVRDNTTNTNKIRLNFTLPVPNGSASVNLASNYLDSIRNNSVYDSFGVYTIPGTQNKKIFLSSEQKTIPIPITSNGNLSGLSFSGAATSPSAFVLTTSATAPETQTINVTAQANTTGAIRELAVQGTRNHNSTSFSTATTIEQLSSSHLVPTPQSYVSTNNSYPRDFVLRHEGGSIQTSLIEFPATSQGFGFAWWDNSKKVWWVVPSGSSLNPNSVNATNLCIRYTGGRYIFTTTPQGNLQYGWDAVTDACSPSVMPWMANWTTNIRFRLENPQPTFLPKTSDICKMPKPISVTLTGIYQNGSNYSTSVENLGHDSDGGGYSKYLTYAPWATQQLSIGSYQGIGSYWGNSFFDIFYYSHESKRWIFKDQQKNYSYDDGLTSSINGTWQSDTGISSFASPMTLSRVQGWENLPTTLTATFSGGELGDTYTFSDLGTMNYNFSVDSDFVNLWS